MADDFSSITNLLQQSAETTRKKKEEEMKSSSTEVEDIFSDWDFSEEDDSFDDDSPDVIPFDTAIGAFKKKKKKISDRAKLILIALSSGMVAVIVYLIVMMPIVYNIYLNLIKRSVLDNNLELAQKRFNISSIFNFNHRQNIADFVDILFDQEHIDNETLGLAKRKIDMLVPPSPTEIEGQKLQIIVDCELGLERIIRYYIITGNYNMAENAIEDYITFHRENYKVGYYRGKIAYKQGNIHEAIEHYTTSFLYKPDFLEVYVILRRLYVKTENWDNVFLMQNHYIRNLTDDFKDYDYFYDIANAFYFLGIEENNNNYIDRAQEYFQECIKLKPDDFYSIWKLALINDRFENYEEAISFYNRYKQLRTNDPKVHINLGIIYYYKLDKPNIREAVRNFQQAVTINPDEFEAYYHIANLFLFEFDNYPNAIKNYHKALEGGYFFDDIYFQLATAYLKNNDFPNAISYYNRFLLDNENDRDTLNNLALAKIQNQNFNEAIHIYSNFLAIHAPDDKVYNNLGVIYELMNAEEEAIRNYWLGVELLDSKNKLGADPLVHNNFRRFMSRLPYENIENVLDYNIITKFPKL